VLHTAAATLLRKCGGPDPSKDLHHEFRRLVDNEAHNSARQRRSRPRPMTRGDEDPLEETLAVQPEQEPALTSKESFARLPTDEHRRILALCIAGFTERQIAEKLGISVRTVQGRKRDIREILGPELLP
jgi:DNA-directed RNA polymerase specialized sigma24 family protein